MYETLSGTYENGYRALADAIILQAVKDYRKALRVKNKCAGNKLTLERFFASQWFRELTDLDGKMIARKIRKEYK